MSRANRDTGRASAQRVGDPGKGKSAGIVHTGSVQAGPVHVAATQSGPVSDRDDVDLRRRIVYLMLFRLIVITLVMGSTLLLWWASDVDLAAPSSLLVYGIIAATYLLTIVYALALGRMRRLRPLADTQLALDLVMTTILVHITGGAQSGYVFFFPLSIIAGAILHFRAGAVMLSAAAISLFTLVSVFGWLELLPVPAGQRVLPSDLSEVEFGRALALNLAACAAVGMLAYNLGAQVQLTSASLESQRVAVADLRTLNEDIVRSLSSGLITVDRDSRILSLNRAACDILGMAPEESVGRPFEDVLPGVGRALAGGIEGRNDGGNDGGSDGDGESRSPELAELAETTDLRERVERAHCDIALSRDDGERSLSVALSPLRNNRDIMTGWIVHVQDLTELRAMEQQMRQAERLAVLGTLAAGVAHEIRNPLASISGSIELLRATPLASTSGESDDDDRHTLMDIVTREVDRLEGLIRDFLDYANPQPRELLNFDLAILIDETVKLFAQDRSYDEITMEADLPESEDGGSEEVRICADPGRIRQVLWNLLRNGAEAASSEVRVSLTRDDGHAVIEVRDDGGGISPEDYARIFDPFFTTKSHGSGLGLATCERIVREHGGRIFVDSSEGGARFCVYLPDVAPG